MIYTLLGFTVGLVWWAAYVLRHLRGRLAQEYLTGFRDGQMAEARANHDSRLQRVQVPLSGRN